MQSFTPQEPGSLNQSVQEIAGITFRADKILRNDPETKMPVCGVNLACAWPLPACVRESYNSLYRKLNALDPNNHNFYIYPYKQTHITVATFINFKNHIDPLDDAKDKIEKMVPDLYSKLKYLFVDDTAHRIKPFTIEMGPLILSPNAAIILIMNHGGEIVKMRSILHKELDQLLKIMDITPDCKNDIRSEFSSPEIIHSTILRFKNDFHGGIEFAKRFLSVKPKKILGEATIEKLLLTVETQPYMCAGKKHPIYL